jgi:hypothetical protein
MRESPNGSCTLSSFASGAGMRTQQVVFFKEDAWTKTVKIPGAGKNESNRALQAPTLERLCSLQYFPVQGPCLVSNKWRLILLTLVKETMLNNKPHKKQWSDRFSVSLNPPCRKLFFSFLSCSYKDNYLFWCCLCLDF